MPSHDRPSPVRRFLLPSTSSARSTAIPRTVPPGKQALKDPRPPHFLPSTKPTQPQRLEEFGRSGQDDIQADVLLSPSLPPRSSHTRFSYCQRNVADDIIEDAVDDGRTIVYEGHDTTSQDGPAKSGYLNTTGVARVVVIEHDSVRDFLDDFEIPLSRKRRRISSSDIIYSNKISPSSLHVQRTAARITGPRERHILELPEHGLELDNASDHATTSDEELQASPLPFPAVSSRFRVPTPAAKHEASASAKPFFRLSSDPRGDQYHLAAGTALPDAFSPSRRRGKQDYDPGGAAETVRNWVLGLAAEESQSNLPQTDCVTIATCVKDQAGRFAMVDGETGRRWLLVGQQGRQSIRQRDNNSVARLDVGKQVLVRGSGTRWELNLPEAYAQGLGQEREQISVSVLWEIHSEAAKIAAAPFQKALIFPSRTTHTRLFPTKHSFSYSYLYVGIPIGWNGPAGSVLRADTCLYKRKTGLKRSTWFSVESEDYLERGVDENGFSGKLRGYLESQGVDADAYPQALLVTAPRFLGFSFNPVSFWYLYDRERTLAAMILEVNNTFDERRMYFMPRTTGHGATVDEALNFRHEWQKDFHVSPFNDREGTYSLSANSPLLPAMSRPPRIDNTIVLKSSDGKPKLVARVFSSEAAIEVDSMTRMQTLAFVARWWWVGFMTNPRILREARILWVKKLQLFYRPEVWSSSIGRKETIEERDLEHFFRIYLQNLIWGSGCSISYISAAGPKRGKMMLLESLAASDNFTKTIIEVRVLTPAIYSEIVRSKSVRDQLDKWCFRAGKGEAMLQITDPDDFLGLLKGAGNLDLVKKHSSSIKWKTLSYLRQDCSTLVRPSLMRSALRLGSAECLARESLSELDYFVLGSCNSEETSLYCNAVIRTLLADKIAFGWTSLLRFYAKVLCSMLAFVALQISQTLLTTYSSPSASIPASAMLLLGLSLGFWIA